MRSFRSDGAILIFIGIMVGISVQYGFYAFASTFSFISLGFIIKDFIIGSLHRERVDK